MPIEDKVFIRRMLNFLRYRIFSSTHRALYFLALISALIGIMALVCPIPVEFSMTAAGLSVCLYFLGHKIKQQKLKTAFEPTLLKETEQRTVNTGGGNYNESVQGDYVQGDYINIQNTFIGINQGETQIISEFRRILAQLHKQGYSAEATEQRVAADLAAEINKNRKVKKKLSKWTQYLGNETTQSSEEVARRFVRRAAENSSPSAENSNIERQEKYKKLRDFLKAEQWKEADEETVRVIAKLMPSQGYSYIDIEQIPPKDLKTINNLWVKHSDGRFGFSVQQRIWKKALKLYRHHSSYGEGYPDEEAAFKAFCDCVDWSMKSDYIYYDFTYSLEASPGHLPAMIMLVHCYDSYSNRCYFDTSIFEDLMECDYESGSFIPEWIKRWLLMR